MLLYINNIIINIIYENKFVIIYLYIYILNILNNINNNNINNDITHFSLNSFSFTAMILLLYLLKNKIGKYKIIHMFIISHSQMMMMKITNFYTCDTKKLEEG